MFKRFAVIGFLSLSLVASANDLKYYFGDDQTFDPNISAPAKVLGMNIGDWHIRHDQLVTYMETLAQESDRVQITTMGRTHENRELLLLAITSPENQARLEELRTRHVEAITQTTDADYSTAPVVIWLGYSIHGNEPSGSNSVPLMAYYLAAGQGDAVEKILKEAIILIDPSQNPDGLARFATWANMHRGKNPSANPDHREHNEAWPGGRTNHYWFDLNRDWLPAQHPESQARLKMFHHWKPNILCDFHEMGTDSTFFFQPGVPTRQNPMTPRKNFELTSELAKYHAKALDKLGQLYFSQENFDDFYYGKGSTYPDVNGAVGILFEQASSRGHRQESSHGVLTFPRTIKNQLTTALSTVSGGIANREELLRYQREFYAQSKEQAKADPIKAYLFGDDEDPTRAYAFIEILKRHQINVYQIKDLIRRGTDVYQPGAAFMVPTYQHQYRLIKAIFQTQLDFEDSTFYDISTWTMPFAFGLPYTELKGREFQSDLQGELVTEAPNRANQTLPENPYAYLLEWKHYYAPRVAQKLLAAGLRVHGATQQFTAETDQGKHTFSYGTLMIPSGYQEMSADRLSSLIQEISQTENLPFFTTQTGLTPEGMDFGSGNFATLKMVKPLMLGGSSVSPYEVGEVWHLLDNRMDIEVSITDIDRLRRVDLNRYTHLIMVGSWGGYRDIGKKDLERIQEWVANGGTIVATRNAVNWVIDNKFIKAKVKTHADEKAEGSPPRLAYGDYSRDSAKQVIGGSIFLTEVDLTHPLGYGFSRHTLPSFRNSTIFLEPSDDPYATAAQYSDNPLLSGYISAKNLELARNAASALGGKSGQGQVFLLTDNPNFRAFWYGTNRLFLNSLFFGPTLNRTGATE